MMRWRLMSWVQLPLLCGLAVAMWLAAVAVEAQMPAMPGDRLAGLQWTFARVKYTASYERLGAGRPRMSFWDDPWAIDAPAAEQNLSRRIRSVTAIQVGEPVVIELTDERLWQFPWLYLVEPSNLDLQPNEIPILREFLLRGGTLTFDDFHGPVRMGADGAADGEGLSRPGDCRADAAASHFLVVLPARLLSADSRPRLVLQRAHVEKGGFQAHLRAILDDDGRPMVLFNWNTDMGDGVEWSNAEEYPGYLRWTALSYQMLINEVVYSLTH